MKKLFSIIFLNILLIISFVFASPTEYLFKDESLGQIDMTIEINDQKYNIYKVNNNQNSNILICDLYGNIPSDEILQKNIITYYTHFYIKDNEESIRSHFHITANKLDEKVKSNYQKILDTFKSLSLMCVAIPSFQLLQFCVKPSDKLDIMKVSIGTIKILPDWNIALNNYKKLGGNIFYFTDKSETMRYSFTEDIYKDFMATYNFLLVVEGITDEKFIENDVINPEKITIEVNRNAEEQFKSIKNRVSELKKLEHQKFEQVEIIIDEIKSILKNIAGINGNLKDIRDKYYGLKNGISLISLNDQKFRTDIDALNIISVEAEELKKQAENSYSNQFNSYQEKNFIERFIIDIIGSIRSISY